MDIRAGRDAHEKALFLRQAARHDERLVVGHRDDFVDDFQVQISRHEAGPGALDFMRPRLERFALQRLRDDR